MTENMTICVGCKHYVREYDGFNRNLCRKHINRNPVSGVEAFAECVDVNRGDCKSFEETDLNKRMDENLEEMLSFPWGLLYIKSPHLLTLRGRLKCWLGMKI